MQSLILRSENSFEELSADCYELYAHDCRVFLKIKSNLEVYLFLEFLKK